MTRYLTRPRFNWIDLLVAVYAALLWKVDDSPGWAIAVFLGGAFLSTAIEFFFWGRKK